MCFASIASEGATLAVLKALLVDVPDVRGDELRMFAYGAMSRWSMRGVMPDGRGVRETEVWRCRCDRKEPSACRVLRTCGQVVH